MDKKRMREMKEYFEETYFNKGKAERIEENVWKNIHEPEKKKRNAFVYFGAAALLLLGLISGSAFVSPTISNALSHIPVLNMIFEDDSDHAVSEAIEEKLKDANYAVAGIEQAVRNKTYRIGLNASEGYINRVEGDIKILTEKLLNEKGLDAYTVEVFRMNTEGAKSSVPTNENLLAEGNSIKEQLAAKGYDIGKVTLFPDEETVSVGFGGEREQFESMKSKLSETIESFLRDSGKGDYSVNLFREVPGTSTAILSSKGWASYDARERKNMIMQSRLFDALSSKGYAITKISYVGSGGNPRVQIDVFEEENEEGQLKEAVRSELDTLSVTDADIYINARDKETLQTHERWTPIMHTLTTGLTGQKELHVESVGFGFQKEPILISVKTTLDRDEEEAVQAIREETEEFMTSNEVEEIIGEDAYKIEIKSKN